MESISISFDKTIKKFYHSIVRVSLNDNWLRICINHSKLYLGKLTDKDVSHFVEILLKSLKFTENPLSLEYSKSFKFGLAKYFDPEYSEEEDSDDEDQGKTIGSVIGSTDMAIVKQPG